MTIHYRSFLNTDPPLLVEIWRKQKRFRGLMDRISHEMIEELVLSKPYFDPRGLMLAWDNDQPVGFVQTGFCPVADMSDIDRRQGVISQLRVIDRGDSSEIAAGLLAAAEAYLNNARSVVVHAGGRFPCSPYYHGLYGGSRIPGVLNDDALMTHALTAAGYEPQGEVVIYHRRLAGFRTAVDRQQMTLRRQYQVQADTDPPFENWWEACTLGKALRTRFEVTDRQSAETVGVVTYWDIQPLANCWGVRAMGMYDLKIKENQRRCGIATFLVGESLRHLAQEGVAVVEAQSLAEDAAACGVYAKHGFEVVGRGTCFAKKLAAD